MPAPRYMAEVPCEYCGWTAREPSPIQAQVAFDKHRRLECPHYRMCMSCTDMAAGSVRKFDDNDKKEKPSFICDRCWNEHPRLGGYAFDNMSSPSKNSPRAKVKGKS